MKFDSHKTVFLIDGSAFLYRAYYGMRPLHTSKGEPVHAVYSFCRMFKKLINTFFPRYIALVWDSKGPTVRHALYDAYKATRQAPPSDLFIQKEKIYQFADLIGLRQAELPGYEADDLMFSIGKEQQLLGFQVVFVTSDKDMGQALGGTCYLYDYFKDQIIDKDVFENKMGFSSEKLPFYFALLGDASDNIPGVHGIGEKTARELVIHFDSLNDLYARIDEVEKPRIKSALVTHKNDAFLSLDLFLLRYVSSGVTTRGLQFDSKNWVNAFPLFKELEFTSLLAEIDLDQEQRRVLFEEKIAAIKKYTLKTVTTQDELLHLAQEIVRVGECAVDTEADGVNPLQARLVGISLCIGEGIAYYVPFGHQTGETQLSYAEVKTVLKPVLEDPRVKKYLHHAKFDQLLFSTHDIELASVTFDSLIAASLLTRDWQRIGLKQLSMFYFDEQMLSFDEVVKEKKLPNFSYVPLALATYYSAYDAHQTFRLAKLFQKELAREHIESLFYEIEMPVSQVLYAMEKYGIHVDRGTLQELDHVVAVELSRIEREITDMLGPEHEKINLNSPRQVEQLLFYVLKLPPQKKSDKGTGYSTDQEVLEALSVIHPIPSLILRYRELFKLQSTYIQALPMYINPRDNRIHTTFSQTRVATGRLASTDPNLQNIPAAAPGIGVRGAFKADEGKLFISADYSQIELRVLAFLSQDDNLKQAFLCGRDIHRETAARLFGVSFDQVTNEQRQVGKRINFSILYGLTPYGLSKDLNIPFKDGKLYIERYFDQYPKVRDWMDVVVKETEQKGYVTTYWGRKRYIPGIYEKNQVLYQEARRIAINTVAQGTAAEIMKRGMIALHERFQKDGGMAQILLQIHDELLIMAPQENRESIEQMVKETLEGVVNWNVPLAVTIRHGADWKEVSK